MATPGSWAAAPLPQPPLAIEAPRHSYAFQPIVDVAGRCVHSHEALVRGPAGESAAHVFARVPAALKYDFDRDSRVAAIELAARLQLDGQLNLNFLPQGLYQAERPIVSIVEAAAAAGIALERIVLEVTEGEVIDDLHHFAGQLDEFRSQGLKVAIDDFGAGYSGLNLLADFQPDQVKIDMNLVRGIECHGPRQAIVRAIVQVCCDLGIDVIAEGVESLAEFRWFEQQGVFLFQGYLFSKPGFECLPPVHFPQTG